MLLLQALSLEWSSGKDVLRCTNRLDLTLNGSFADMILVPNAGARENNNPGASLFLLTNPGQLHVYDDTTLAAFSSQQEKNHIRAMPFPVVVPMLEPYMSVAKLMSVPMGGISSKALLEVGLFYQMTCCFLFRFLPPVFKLKKIMCPFCKRKEAPLTMAVSIISI